jgi:hypothetical protein
MFLRPALVSRDRLYRALAYDPNRGPIAAKLGRHRAYPRRSLPPHKRDNRQFRDLPDWKRGSYWHFFLPTPSSKELHFRDPKMWEVACG